MVIRVHGGIITDQMLSGGLRFFKLSSAALGYFEFMVSDGTVRIPGTDIGATNLSLLIAGQTESDYGGTPPEGDFAGGTGYLGGLTSDDYTQLAFATAPNTITRNDGTAFDADGVVVGQKLVIANSENAGENDGTVTVTGVTATVITVAETLVVNADDTTATISVFDILTLSGGSIITVNTAGTGGTGAAISAFTVTVAGAVGFTSGTTRTVTSETAGNSDFTLTPDADNEIAATGIFFVPADAPVPNSVADRIFKELTGKATVVILNQIDDDNIHFACDDSGFGWDTPAVGDAAAEMLIAIKALGVAGVIGGGAVDSDDPPVPDDTTTGVPTRDLNVGGVTLTETTPFELT